MISIVRVLLDESITPIELSNTTNIRLANPAPVDIRVCEPPPITPGASCTSICSKNDGGIHLTEIGPLVVAAKFFASRTQP